MSSLLFPISNDVSYDSITYFYFIENFKQIFEKDYQIIEQLKGIYLFWLEIIGLKERSRRLLKKRIFYCFVCFLFFIGCQEDIPQTKEIQTPHVSIQTIDVAQYIGKDLTEVINDIKMSYIQGPSRYGYEWIVFKDEKKYISVGHINSQVVTVAVIGENVLKGNVVIGDKYDNIARILPIQRSIFIKNKKGEYRFELTEEERNLRPLVQLTDNVYAQLYFDRYSRSLVAVRVMDDETLIKHRPYRLVYRGDLKKFTSSSQAYQTGINRMNEKQIYDVTNVLRRQYGKSKLSWSRNLANVAFQHSKDMKENQYFDHVSPENGDLEKRLKKGNIAYTLAGENIASGYPDGIDAVIGWLNSPDHRETLLYDEFTHIGVGVYEEYYTQNFIRK